MISPFLPSRRTRICFERLQVAARGDFGARGIDERLQIGFGHAVNELVVYAVTIRLAGSDDRIARAAKEKKPALRTAPVSSSGCRQAASSSPSTEPYAALSPGCRVHAAR